MYSCSVSCWACISTARAPINSPYGDKKAEKTLALAEDYDKLLSTILIGNNIVNNVAEISKKLYQ